MKTEKEQGLAVFVLLDESRSMDQFRDQTIKATNEYIENLTLVAMPATVTVVAFGGRGVDTVIDARPAYALPKLTRKNYEPFGGTPLCRAIGESIVAMDRINARQKAMVILTDGQDRGGYGWTARQVKAEVKKRIAQGWLFLFIGAEEANAASAALLGIPKKQVSYCSLGQIGEMMEKAAMDTLEYQSSGKV